MKKNTVLTVTAIFLACVLLSGICVSSIGGKTPAENLPTVIVDAGHGGEDGGAVANDGTAEKVINLQIAKKVEALLKMFGYDVIMTRETDDAVCSEGLSTIRQRKVSDIKNRFKIIQDNPDALFVSIHQNKFSDPSQSGTQVFYSPNDPSSMLLAECIQNSVLSSLCAENRRGVKKCGSSVYLLYHAQSTAVMVECGFVSNDEELAKLKDDGYQKQMALAIVAGINDYISNETV